MPEFKNLNQESGLAELNTFLATRSFIDGYKASGADAALLPSIAAQVDAKKFPHVSRWLTQITSFSIAQRAAWGGAAAAASAAAAKPAAAAAKPAAAAAAAPKKKKAVDSDDDFGLSSDSDDDEAIQAIADAHNKARAAKAAASGKSAKIDKSMLTIFVKPAEDTTDMNALAKKIIATIQIDSLQWGADYKLVPVAYGIMKAKMVCTYEDLKCSPDDVIEAIEEIEEVQSVDMDSVNILA